MTASRIRLVVFDLGGVLVRLCRSWREACESAGVPYRDGADELSVREARWPWIRAHEVGEIDDREYFDGLSSAMAGLYSPPEVRRIHAAWVRDEVPGVSALLDDLATSGLETAILSNTNAIHWTLVTGATRDAGPFPALARVRHAFASHLLSGRKPEREVFLHVERATGKAPEEILFFDDLVENVEGARGAGWDAEVVVAAGDGAAEMRAHLVRKGVLAAGKETRGRQG